MAKLTWKPGTMVYPLPAVMVSCGDMDGEKNIVTIAWTGIVCTDPAMTYISIRKERHSYDIIKNSGEFVINLTNKDLAFATDFCGVKSGRDLDKFSHLKLTPEKATIVSAPMIEEAPISIECRVTEIKELGSHDMFLAEILAVNVDEKYMDETGKFNLDKSNPICYSHGNYYEVGDHIGRFGYSVMKKKTKKKIDSKKRSMKKNTKK